MADDLKIDAEEEISVDEVVPVEGPAGEEENA